MLCDYLWFIFLFICFASTVKLVKHQNNNDSSLYLFSTYSLPRLSLGILYVLCNIYIKFMMCDFIYISISSTYLSIYLSSICLSVCLFRLREAVFQLVSSVVRTLKQGETPPQSAFLVLQSSEYPATEANTTLCIILEPWPVWWSPYVVIHKTNERHLLGYTSLNAITSLQLRLWEYFFYIEWMRH